VNDFEFNIDNIIDSCSKWEDYYIKKFKEYCEYFKKGEKK
jgi:hypothetical protein